MALDNPNEIVLELEADVYLLRRKGNKVGLIIEGREVHPDITGASVSEAGDLTILGRPLGKINPDFSSNVDLLPLWYPPGQVGHPHTVAEFDAKKDNGIVVGKFSATWCGPCKMVAPAIAAMSNEFSDVTFMHLEQTEAALEPLFSREDVSCFPTFKFWKDGEPKGKIEGADAAAVKKKIIELGAVPTVNETSEPIADGEINFICARDVVKITNSEGNVTVTLNGEEKKDAFCGIDVKTQALSFGKGSGKLWSGGNYDIAALAAQMTEMFPTKVKHIHSVAEFDGIIANGVTLAKYSAEWCGPCKAIAGAYHGLSNKLDGKVNVLHIDVDESKVLSQREGIEAMPTFHFYVDGVKNGDLMVRGADLAKVKANLKNLGVEL